MVVMDIVTLNDIYWFISWFPYCLSEPNEELVKVLRLTFDELKAGVNDTFSATIRWRKPLFKHSAVKHYLYKVLDTTQQRPKRDTGLQTVSLFINCLLFSYCPFSWSAKKENVKQTWLEGIYHIAFCEQYLRLFSITVVHCIF